MERATLTIEGMSCGHCVRAVTRALEEMEDVRVEHVEIGAARVAYDAARTAPERMATALRDEGYEVAHVGRGS